jgi:hypothetical protein
VRRSFRCDSCRKSFSKVPMAPVLHDEVWGKLAHPHEILCAPCMFSRAIERNVHLTLASLRPCPFNLSQSPQSWFDVFRSDEIGPPRNIDEWQMIGGNQSDG